MCVCVWSCVKAFHSFKRYLRKAGGHRVDRRAVSQVYHRDYTHTPRHTQRHTDWQKLACRWSCTCGQKKIAQLLIAFTESVVYLCWLPSWQWPWRRPTGRHWRQNTSVDASPPDLGCWKTSSWCRSPSETLKCCWSPNLRQEVVLIIYKVLSRTHLIRILVN